VEELFGPRVKDDAADAGRSRRGWVAFRGEARLPAAARDFFNREQNRGARKLLFRRIAATRIDARGVAEDKTLRAVEAVVPLTLEAQLEWIGADPPPYDWVALLDAACAATLSFGKLKADGYGRAIASITPEPNP